MPVGYVADTKALTGHLRIGASLGAGYVALSDVIGRAFPTTYTFSSASIDAAVDGTTRIKPSMKGDPQVG